MGAVWNLIEKLRDPALVADVQRYYGVIRNNSQSKDVSKVLTSHTEINGQNGLKKRGPKSIYQKHDSTTIGDQNSDTDDEDTVSSESDTDDKDFIITNRFWFYLFTLGTALGDELFYATFIPFWFWNVDGAVGRRMVLVWAIIMYVGQGIKDLVCWPRPGHPAVRLQKKWALEYGMPSTHAMVGVAIPFSVLLYTIDRYQYPVFIGVIIAVSWCTLVCVSRVYLGMHTILDIIVGLILAVVLLIPIIPLVDKLDHTLLTWRWSPVVLLVSSISLVIFYPRCGEQWTPTRGDTAMVLSVTAGVHMGAWTNYQLGVMRESHLPPPYTIIWPTYEMLGFCLLRTVIGLSCVLATRAWCKWASYATVCALLRLNARDIKQQRNSVHNRQKNIVELSYKFITSILVGFNTLYLMPSVFRFLGIARPTFYTEI